MRKSKWARLAVGAIFLAAAAAGIRAGAEGPADAEQHLAREGGPRDDRGPPRQDDRGPPRQDDRGPPRGDDRGPPPRERGPGQFNGPPRGEFRPDDRGPREDREGRPDGPGRGSEGRAEGREGRPGNREDGPPPPRPELGSVLPPFVRGQIKLTDEQQKQIEELQQDVRSKLKTILTADQISRAEEAMRQGPPRPQQRDDMQGRGLEGRGPGVPGPGPGERGDGPRRFDGPRDGNFRDGGPRDGGGPGGPREGRRGPDDDRREGPPPRDGGRRPPPEDDRRSEAPKDLKSSIGANATA